MARRLILYIFPFEKCFSGARRAQNEKNTKNANPRTSRGHLHLTSRAQGATGALKHSRTASARLATSGCLGLGETRFGKPAATRGQAKTGPAIRWRQALFNFLVFFCGRLRRNASSFLNSIFGARLPNWSGGQESKVLFCRCSKT